MVEYSQSGDVTSIVDSFVRPLHRADVELRRERLRPIAQYPYPWGSLRGLFSIFPECFVGSSSGIYPLALQPADRFDLVILAYQVWFLNPSLPIQAFFRSEWVGVLRNTPVVTLSVSRKMWHSASETMKHMLHDAGAVHLDNVVVTHQGPPFSTLVSVPRALLYGKRDRLWGIFPSAELSRQDLDRLERLGVAVASQLGTLRPPYHPLLRGLGAVEVNRRYMAPELCGWYFYRAGARWVARIGSRGERARQLAIMLFIGAVLGAILFLLPLSILLGFVLRPFLHGKMQRYAQRLAEPSG